MQEILQYRPAKKEEKKKKEKVQLTKDDAFLYWSSSCAVCWCLATTSNRKQCESVQQILQHPGKKKRKKTQRCLSLLVLFLCSVLVANFQEVQLTKDEMPFFTDVLFLCSVLVADFQEAWHLLHALSPRTLLTENICESVQQILQHSPAKRKRKKRGSTHQR